MFSKMKNAVAATAVRKEGRYIGAWPCAGLPPRGDAQNPQEWLRAQTLATAWHVADTSPRSRLDEPWGGRDLGAILDARAAWAFASDELAELVGGRVDIGCGDTIIVGVPVVGVIPPDGVHVRGPVILVSDECADELGATPALETAVWVRPSEEDAVYVWRGIEAAAAAYPEAEACAYIAADPADGVLFSEWVFPSIDGAETPEEWLAKQTIDTLRYMDLWAPGLDGAWNARMRPWAIAARSIYSPVPAEERGIGALLDQRRPWVIAARALGFSPGDTVALLSAPGARVEVAVVGVMADALFGARTFVLSRAVAETLKISGDWRTEGVFLRG